MTTSRSAERRALLEALFGAAVAGADPSRFTRAALDRRLADLDDRRRVVVVAIGKAAGAMSAAAVEALARRGRAPALGVVVAPEPLPAPHPSLRVVGGDHPLPGDGSLAASRAIGEVVGATAPDDGVLLLLSGGATSLAAAPPDGITAADLRALYALLLESGLDIVRMNIVRKRVSRWGAGRLAAALAPARILPIVLSDVLGDDVATIGSGPCVADPTTATEVRRLLDAHALTARVPDAVLAWLDGVVHGTRAETPKPGDPSLGAVLEPELLEPGAASEAIAAAARARSVAALVGAPIAGEASAQGTQLAEDAVRVARQLRLVPGAATTPLVLLHGGESTVTRPAGGGGHGGRSQELALAAARTLARADADGDAAAHDVAILAAGTDGRDGPTDAAGAIVDATTWRRILERGRDAELDLARHDSHRALDAAGALMRTGLTGTNAADIAIALVETPRAAPAR